MAHKTIVLVLRKPSDFPGPLYFVMLTEMTVNLQSKKQLIVVHL